MQINEFEPKRGVGGGGGVGGKTLDPLLRFSYVTLISIKDNKTIECR